MAHTQRGLSGLWWREHFGAVIASVIVVAAACWFVMRTPANATADCRARYQSAHTAADSARVDDEVVGRRTDPWTCGMLRRTGATLPRNAR